LTSLAENREVNEALLPYVPRLVVDWLRTRPSDRYRRIHGTLAFVDISGFTRLAERLARKGKVGAEELSDTLNTTFTELLSVAYEYGAGVIKWGGDAVLLLFEGDEHELRAARGMAEMQRTIRRVGRIRTESGNVVLRMSIGVNSGAFDFFLVGESHRELLIAGEAATATVALEAVADAGEIVVAPSTAAALLQRNLGPTKGPGFLLRGAPEATPWPASQVGDVADLAIERCIPVAIREHLLLTDREPEHRNIAVSFVEFRGTDGLILSRGGDEVAEALHACISNVQAAVERHSATFHETDISKDGGKILLLSGAPRSAGDDEERILRTVRSIFDEETALPLRAGVNCGPVFSGDFGPPYRRTFSVKGDAVNLAARLMGKAETGEIVASDEVVRRSRTVFAIQQLEPFFVKGKSAAIRAHTVAGVRGRSGPVAEAPLVGREQELQELFDALASARDWQGRYVEIAAEAGMGKSRLVDELRARADGTTVVSTACVEYESATPYYAVRALLRMLLGLEGLDEVAAGERLTTLVAELAPRLLPWLPLLALPLHIDVPSTPEVDSLKDEFRKSRLEEVVQELLGLGLLAPTIMLFEDIHWMDEASRELLGVLVDHLEDRPWLLVATTRPSPAGLERRHPWTRRLELVPLAEDDALQLLEDATADAPLPPHQLELLRGRAHGNPLYLRELVTAAQRFGGVEELPESVGGVIGAQIDRLGPADRTALRRAAVLGVTFEERLLRTVVDDMSTVDFCNRLGEFLETSPGRIRFRHALVRDTAYEGLSYRRRRELHGAVADAIAGSSDGAGEAEAALLSLHYHEAQRYPEAWRYSLTAGRSAMTMYANSDSERFLERAVDSAHRLTELPRREVAEAYELLGEVRLRLADYDRGGVSLREARRLLRDDPVESARLMLREGVIQWRRGRHGQAMRWIRRGMRLLEGVEGAEAQKHRAQLYVWHGVVRLRQGRAREAIDWCRRAIAEATAADARRPLAHGYYILDYALTSLGRYAEAVHAERALAIYEELGDLNEQATVLNQLGILAYYQGRWDDAIDCYRRAEDAWERAGDRWLGSFPTANRAELLSDQGRLEEAEPLLRGALRVAVAAGAPGRIADVKSHLGRLAARAGRFEEALEVLKECRAIYEGDSVLSEVLLMDARIAECLAFAGDAPGALARCDEALARTASLDDLFVLLPVLNRLRGWALLATGDLDQGVEALTLSMEAAREKEVVYEVALTADALAHGQRLRGQDAGELEALRDAIFSTLGVVDAGVLVLPRLDEAGLRLLTRVG